MNSISQLNIEEEWNKKKLQKLRDQKHISFDR